MLHDRELFQAPEAEYLCACVVRESKGDRATDNVPESKAEKGREREKGRESESESE